MAYYVYILQCGDGSLYTGITTDLARRVREHNGVVPGGARYTSGRRPVTLVYSENCASRSDAQQREYAIKRLSTSEKRALIARAVEVI